MVSRTPVLGTPAPTSGRVHRIGCCRIEKASVNNPPTDKNKTKFTQRLLLLNGLLDLRLHEYIIHVAATSSNHGRFACPIRLFRPILIPRFKIESNLKNHLEQLLFCYFRSSTWYFVMMFTVKRVFTKHRTARSALSAII